MMNRSMQEPTFLILTALVGGPQHGYGIITDVLRISGEPRRYYRLAPSGEERLAAETEQLRRNVETATARPRSRLDLGTMGSGA
ncbi:hypothetical protein [Nonomuraea rubra]|uniref:hypothetical protein n=1 Tax=Nonomuraea rubra TaxID=46180 RepID=UPI0033E2B710